MSKMRLSKLAAVALALAVLAGCAHQAKADDPNVRGIGYVRVDDAIKKHPLYPQLSQIQDAIDALGLKSLSPAVTAHTPAEIAAQTKELNNELKAAQARANEVLRKKQMDYAQREQAAIRAALAAAGAGTNGSQTPQQMQSISATQAQQVASQANADFQAYQQSVIRQDNAAVAQIQKQLNDRANQAYRQRATQLQEQESQLALELSQQDASKRLDLRMKLNNLAMSDAQRKSYRDQLAALDSQEAAVVDARRKADQKTLAAYQQQLRDQTARDITAQAQKIHDQTRAKLASRHDEVTQQVASQLKGLQPAAIPTNLPAATQQKIADIDKTYKTQFQADAQKTIQQYQQTKADLDAQYAALQGASGAAVGASGKQLADLQRQRDDLYNKMVDQIKHDAGQVAAQRGLRVVFMNVEGAAGGIDLTDDVEKDIESLHQ
jgi:hypothetical protein